MDNPDLPYQPAPPRSPPNDVLVVEDNYMIAIDTADMLREIGIETVRTAGSVEQALEMIAAQAPQYGLLDVNMGGEMSFTIADHLLALGIPFAFATGYGDQYAFPQHFSATPMVVKPYSPERLRTVLMGDP
ncbi:response regulator [uncultured Hyphomicrobium sp.]|uniref:response regulator n=1 Tax=uncultured Hyphomicrobium sp. TaxID=194373 RepID=UPI0025FB2626|nr:response regulator [uncultured Hyphomicrobium sp.]